MKTIDFTELTKIEPVFGGDINQAFKVRNLQHQLYFLKEHRSHQPHFFRSETEGLKALKKSAKVSVPEIVASTEHQLLLEWIEPGVFTTRSWSLAGQQLAELHLINQANFGFSADNYCGLTPQINTNMNDGYTFFIECRLLHLLRMARNMELLEDKDCLGVEAICRKLPTIIPNQKPALLHGDLWSGNLMTNILNEPVFIDPACYFGWPEADLAMTTLFGRFPEAFYDAYFGVRPEAKGFNQRRDIYNLYHLLNHLILFGKSYQSQVRQIIRQWA